jgi:Arc/MetJ-type ribon-helix-helix transcriptional regulator
MTIQLRPEYEALIQKDLARGAYRSIEEFVERAVQLLHDEEALLHESREAIHEQIGLSLAQLDQGHGISGEVSRTRLQNKKAAWLEQQQRQA